VFLRRRLPSYLRSPAAPALSDARRAEKHKRPIRNFAAPEGVIATSRARIASVRRKSPVPSQQGSPSKILSFRLCSLKLRDKNLLGCRIYNLGFRAIEVTRQTHAVQSTAVIFQRNGYAARKGTLASGFGVQGQGYRARLLSWRPPRPPPLLPPSAPAPAWRS